MLHYTTYHHNDHPDVLVIEATGKMDMAVADVTLGRIQECIDHGDRNFVIDCGDLQIMTSFGLGMLVRVKRRLQETGGAIAIAGASGVVAESLQIVRFDRVFRMFPSVDEAAASLETH
jgi:anti-anti-sigma factor